MFRTFLTSAVGEGMGVGSFVGSVFQYPVARQGYLARAAVIGDGHRVADAQRYPGVD